jgi:DMSO/TMAO reductase YedYZ molybdopterin-dependent catalytic subunit
MLGQLWPALLLMVQNFARSMLLADMMHPDNLLRYEINGEPLFARNGACCG